MYSSPQHRQSDVLALELAGDLTPVGLGATAMTLLGADRREQCRFQRVQVSASEGLANHTVPESCADVREGIGEALTGVRIGWVLSRGAPGDRQEVSGESPLR